MSTRKHSLVLSIVLLFLSNLLISICTEVDESVGNDTEINEPNFDKEDTDNSTGISLESNETELAEPVVISNGGFDRKLTYSRFDQT